MQPWEWDWRLWSPRARLPTFYFSMIESIQETALASQTAIIRTYTELTKSGEGGLGYRGKRRRGFGESGGRPFLIDSVNRSAGDVNDWTLPFPRSGASGNAMLSPNMTDSAESAGGTGATGVMKRRHVRQTHLHPQRKRPMFPTQPTRPLNLE